ncbi:hypothetical protein [Rossellomorea sp. NS-SX7]|uniref:hypothetical protein n=1 Tax=Rossellomorea sp. NS-SX7 TaxID=3463856 RepID=UPI004059EB43
MNAQLMGIAKKHKKWFEEVIINPMGYAVNNRDYYYLVIYKRNNKLKGYAVITTGDFNKNDALYAFEKLVLYSAFMNNFSSIGETRARISPDNFYIPANYLSDYLESNSNDILARGELILKELGVLQEEFVKNANNYTDYYDHHILKTNIIVDSDLDKIIEVLANVNRLQYLAGEKFVSSYEELKEVQSEMVKEGVFSKLPKDNQVFLKELLSSKKETETTLLTLEREKETAHLPYEERMEVSKKGFWKEGQKKLPRYKQDLRYPKP